MHKSSFRRVGKYVIHSSRFENGNSDINKAIILADSAEKQSFTDNLNQFLVDLGVEPVEATDRELIRLWPHRTREVGGSRIPKWQQTEKLLEKELFARRYVRISPPDRWVHETDPKARGQEC